MAEVAEEFLIVYVKFGRGLKDLALTLSTPYEHTGTRGLWIYGPPGTGKSHVARQFFDSVYFKAQNKWFDGYNGEDVILFDDMDTNVLGHHLKIWSDKWACIGEIKGGTIPLRYKFFVVTSNYSIETFYPDDMVMQEVIVCRFHVIHKVSKNQLVDYLKLIN